ncbi:Cyclohexanone monooxygenase [Carbonactinospora thermoautotrophica]|uniref:Cyclohexanone monooxygenase n=1 Tax=Carbonactinospora thermoautotrophica TaxID=1469144 RepID=A0A132MYF2_9ACTN|nr:NAD(P)/FAD-dependent oxidoreductase [Carbonactinospora thermoautotrophica]KWX02931.1 Cyclohexanone monooxygenase [Carbonactinospora thermoautotrophica]
MNDQQRAGDPAVVIVGAGFAGLGMAIQLKRAGVEGFVVLEKADEVGGTWRDNRYPGCACDVQSHLYSYSFEPNPAWSRMFAEQQEIWDYLKHCAEKYRITPHIRFGTELVGAEYDDATGTWRVRTNRGAITTRALVLATGPLHQPAYPDIPGIDRFRGKAFHSAEWDHGYDLAGKRVAVIGTGASAIQFVPRIAPRVDRLHLFQRTPPWILPKPDRSISPLEQRLFRAVPALQRLYRSAIYWTLEARILGFTVHPRLMKLAEAVARQHLRRQVPDPELRRKLTPDYTIGCKRILISNDYYPALTRPNVELVTDGIAEIREHAVVTRDGVERPVDAIIYGTGFHVIDAFDHLDIVGRDGLKLREAWSGGVEAYLGVTVAGFPNLFFLLGPNSGLGHSSMVFMIEAQVRYVLQALRPLLRGDARAVDVRADVQATFNQRLQARLREAVWGIGGCRSWYLDENGVNRALWPGSTAEYWLRTRRLKPAEYRIEA